MALYLLPTQKTMIQHATRASHKPDKPEFIRRAELATPILDEANSAVLFAEAPHTKWASVKDAMSWT
ncbi:MAG: hypothetical protein ABIP11_07985 [Luteimonas sp.]